jgi:(p)ppGpp synthase/HD superfamily hydrolase
MNSTPDPFARLLDAVAFAARAHRGQVRKDNQTPYHSHVFRVCLIARHVFGIDDPAVLTAAVLHDTIEDTTTDYDDLEERFGPEISGWVAALSKDTRLPEEPRETAYKAVLAAAPWQVQVCKLADMYDNLTDSRQLGADKAGHTFRRLRSYLEALQSGLKAPARPAFDMVSVMLAGYENASG